MIEFLKGLNERDVYSLYKDYMEANNPGMIFHLKRELKKLVFTSKFVFKIEVMQDTPDLKVETSNRALD